MDAQTSHQPLRRVVRLVAFLNLAYFGIEFAVARAIGSVSLFADSIDFLEDASVNLLVAATIGWTGRSRGQVGKALAAILLVPGLATLWTAWQKIDLSAAPDAALLSLTGLGALAVNLTCALTLARYRNHRGSLTKAAFLSARNDVLANLAIIATGLVTDHLWPSRWPDLIVGLGIGAMNAGAVRDVWQASRQDGHTDEDTPQTIRNKLPSAE
jgi:Co/Zn/Cd efflux system component